MRTTPNRNEELVNQATRLTGIQEKTALMHAGLETLVSRESARRLSQAARLLGIGFGQAETE